MRGGLRRAQRHTAHVGVPRKLRGGEATRWFRGADLGRADPADAGREYLQRDGVRFDEHFVAGQAAECGKLVAEKERRAGDDQGAVRGCRMGGLLRRAHPDHLLASAHHDLGECPGAKWPGIVRVQVAGPGV